MSRRRKRSLRASLLILIPALVLIGGALLGLYLWEQRELQREADAIAARSTELLPKRLEVYYQGAWYALRDHVETCLIIGLDKTTDQVRTVFEGDILNDLQSDFLLLIVVDRDKESYMALHINRDTMAEIQRLGYGERKLGLITEQLALSHAYGSGGKDSCRNTVRAVSRFLYDVPIDHYYAMTMDAIPVLNDLVGGVRVHIDDDLTPIDPAFVQGTDVTLRGKQALGFVRARMSVTDGTNLRRMDRQRVYITALYKRMARKLRSGDRFAFTLVDTLSDYTSSDLITEELSELVDRLKNYDFVGIESIQGEAVDGEEYVEFYPDEEKLKATVIRLFFEKE